MPWPSRRRETGSAGHRCRGSGSSLRCSGAAAHPAARVSPAVRRCSGVLFARRLPRCHGGTSVASAVRSGLDPPGSGPRDPAPPTEPPSGPGAEPEPLPPPSVARGYPGSFGEVTYGSLLVTTLGYSPTSVLTSSVLSPSSALRAMAISVVPVSQVHQPNALGLPPGLANLASRRPDDTPTRGDGVQLCVVIDDQRSDKTATPLVELNRQHPFATAALDRVLLDRGALGVTAGGRDQQIRAFPHDVQRQQFVVGVEPHALHTGGGAAHRTQRLIGC